MRKGSALSTFTGQSIGVDGSEGEHRTWDLCFTYPNESHHPQNQKPKFGENGPKIATVATRPTPSLITRSFAQECFYFAHLIG